MGPNANKTRRQTNQKIIPFWKTSNNFFGWISASNLGPKTVPKWATEFGEGHFLDILVPSWEVLGSCWLQVGVLEPSWVHFGSKLKGLGLILAPSSEAFGIVLCPSEMSVSHFRIMLGHMPLTICLARRNARSD